MKTKTWLILYVATALFCIGGSGWFAFSTYLKHAGIKRDIALKSLRIQQLEAKIPFPNEESIQLIGEDLENARKSADKQFRLLGPYRKYLDSYKHIEYSEPVKMRIHQFRKLSEHTGFDFAIEEDSAFGLENYSSSIPPPEVFPYVYFELEAMHHLLNTLVDSGAESLDQFSRDLIPGELHGPKKHESEYVHKYPVRLRFQASIEAFQTFLKNISTDRQYFYIPRVIDYQQKPASSKADVYMVIDIVYFVDPSEVQ